MEIRLLIAGIIMLAYALLSRRFLKRKSLNTRTKTAAWHAVFFGLAGFLIVMVAVLSVESRMSTAARVAGFFGPRQLIPSLIGAVLLGGLGYWRAWTVGAKPNKRNYFLTEDLEWAETIYSAVFLAFLLMSFVLQAFKIPSGSMESTLRIGDHLFVNRFIYGLRVPMSHAWVARFKDVGRGDIVVFDFPTADKSEEHCGSLQYGKDFIKRVIAIPGDRVAVQDGLVILNGKPLVDEPYAQYMRGEGRVPRPNVPLTEEQYQAHWEDRTLDKKLGEQMKDNFGPITVPESNYFVMGDNRDRSCDGRFWGPVPAKYLKGKAWFIYWPPDRMGFIR
jgi:signal peptidase I